MAGFKGQGTCKATLNAILQSGSTAYWAVMTSAPSASGGGAEVTAADYSRLAVTLNSTNFPNAVSPSVGLTGTASSANGTLQTLSSATTHDWAPSAGQAVGIALVTTSSGALGVGDILYYAPLSSPRTILTGDPVTIPIGAFIATEL
jgi:hypothetical protein